MITYSKRLVSFIDILGFSEMVKTRPPGDILEIQELLRSFSKKFLHENTFEYKLINVSDSIVRIVNPNSDINVSGALLHEVYNLIYIQAYALWHGFVIRGGLTYGDIYIDSDKDVYFGPALIKAYSLESHVAKFPRIVIDPDLIENLGEFPELVGDGDLSHEIDFFKRNTPVDKDGQTFIDYIAGFESEVDDQEEYLLYLQKTKVLIESGLESKNNKVVKKYIWMKKYYNSIIKGFDTRITHQLGKLKNDLYIA